MPRKPSKKVSKETDFAELYETFKKAIAENPVMAQDPVLKKNLEEFERLVKVGDALYREFEDPAYVMIEGKTGAYVVNPAIAAYHKNHASLLKASEAIWKRTETLVIGGGVKSW